MLGWPLTQQDNSIPKIKRVFVCEENGITISRIQIEILDGLQFYGIFFEQQTSKALPLVISQHGGQGTPELCSGLHGDSDNYNDMTQRILSKGVHVFAPQLLLWNGNQYQMDFNGKDVIDYRRNIDGRLKQVGSLNHCD